MIDDDDDTPISRPRKNQRIGEINGKFAILFKGLLVINSLLVVPAVSWMTGLTLLFFELRESQAVSAKSYETFMAQGPRYTSRDAERDQSILRAEIQQSLSRIQSTLDGLQKDNEILQQKLSELRP